MVPQTLVITQTWVPITTSWRIVCVAASEFHEEKVKDTKVDIDNLLVFVSSLIHSSIHRGLRYFEACRPILSGAFCIPGRVLSKTLTRYGIANPSFFNEIACCHATDISADC